MFHLFQALEDCKCQEKKIEEMQEPLEVLKKEANVQFGQVCITTYCYIYGSLLELHILKQVLK